MSTVLLTGAGLVAGVLSGNVLTHYYPMTLGMIFGMGMLGGAIGYGVDRLIAHFRRPSPGR